MFAQAGELTKVATDGAGTLMIQWGVAGVLVIVLIVGTAYMIRWFMTALKEQRTELMAAIKSQREDYERINAAKEAAFERMLKEQKEAFMEALRAQLKSHEEEMTSHYLQVKEWRTENITESRATRDMLQMWVTRIAMTRIEGDEGDPSKPRKGRSSSGT